MFSFISLNPLILSLSLSIWLRIVHFNDVYKLENLAHLKTLVQQSREGPDQTLVILSGDFCAPYLLSSLDRGQGMVDCLNDLGVTHVCLGNHEADISLDQLKARIEQSKFQWINSNIPELREKGFNTKDWDIIEVTNDDAKRRVCLLGLLTNDPALYRSDAFGGATIEDVQTTAKKLVHTIRDVDLFIPMTHQSIEEDREFCASLGDAFAIPLVLGGHEHTIFNEDVEGCRVLKAGQDAENAFVVDVKWDDEKAHAPPKIQAKLVNTRNYQPCRELQSRANDHLKVLDELEKAVLFRIKDWVHDRTLQSLPQVHSKAFTTRHNRLGPNLACTVLATMMRMGLCCDCCLINAGSIRGSSDYDKFFTYQDLKAEMPYSTEMVVVEIPGSVIEATIRNSRLGAKLAKPEESGGYIHPCNNILYDDEEERIVSMGRDAFDPQKSYLTALPMMFFDGIDNHVPLLEWKEQHNVKPKKNSAIPSKILIVRLFSALLWLKLGSFVDIDSNMDGVLTKAEIRERAKQVYGESMADMVVENVLAVADMNNDGTVTPLEVMIVHYVITDILDHVCTHEELETMKEIAIRVLGEDASDSDVERMVRLVRDAMDHSGNASIQREEIIASLGSLKSRHMFL